MTDPESTLCVRRPDGSATVLSGPVRHVEVHYNPGGDDTCTITWEGAVRKSVTVPAPDEQEKP